FEARVVELSLQGNHVHLLVEAEDQVSLAKAMKGLAVRLARGLNHMMGKRGRVMADRYHSRPPRTPREVKHARHYILHNHRHHAAQWKKPVSGNYRDEFSSASPQIAALLPASRWWLLRPFRRKLREGEGGGECSMMAAPGMRKITR